MTDLDALRQEIDRLDDQIVALLNARARCVVEIGRLKMAAATPVFAADREQQILDRIRHISTGPLSSDSLMAVYRELMSASFALERPPRIAFLGPAASFSHEAALGKFGASVEYEPLADLPGVFEAVSRGHADYGIVPVENSMAGSVMAALDALAATELRICCEIHRQIHLHLLARCGLAEVQRVYSKPEAFAQCQRFLAENDLSARAVAVESTSRAAERARDEPHAAAIAGATAGQLFGLNVLAANVEDGPHNVTRFLVIGRSSPRPSGDDKSSLTFVTVDKAGALVEVLLVFQRHSINMTMLTSRPSRKKDLEYIFFADVEGHADESPLKTALDEARSHCRQLTMLGSYPRSRDIVGG